MARQLTCDFCGQPIKAVALKLYKSVKTGGGTDHTTYSSSADIGECCVLKVNQISWTPRNVRNANG